MTGDPMSDIKQRTIKANGINMRIAEAGEGPLVLLLHGFPESWYSWRHQLPELAAAGFHAVAPDQRGYCGADKPQDIQDYDIRHLTADAAGVLDALGEQTAVVVGHDWGAIVAWNSALLHEDRFRAVCAMSVPYTGRAPMPPLQLMKAFAGDNFFYILYFQEPGVAEAELEADVRHSMRSFMYAASGDVPEGQGEFWQKPKDAKFLTGLPMPEKLPDWLTEEDLDYYVSQFEESGFRGPINWYRNFDRNWEITPELATAQVKQPALFIAGERDGVLRFAPTEPMKQLVPNLKIVMVPEEGHWVQQEAPQAVNEALIGWLKGLPK
jgi:pimeloyl-ACP methyl ester carboxylesterase